MRTVHNRFTDRVNDATRPRLVNGTGDAVLLTPAFRQPSRACGAEDGVPEPLDDRGDLREVVAGRVHASQERLDFLNDAALLGDGRNEGFACVRVISAETWYCC